MTHRRKTCHVTPTHVTNVHLRPAHVVRRHVEVAKKGSRTRQPDARDRIFATWGANELTAESLRVMGIHDPPPSEMYSAADQFTAMTRIVPSCTPVTVYNINYCTFYGVPEDEIKQAWQECVRKNNDASITALFAKEEASVSAYCKSTNTIAWNAVPPRFRNTTHLVKLQKSPDLYPFPDDLVYDRNCTESRNARDAEPAFNFAAVAAISAPPRAKRPRKS